MIATTQETKPLRVGGYIRVSTARQARDGLSLEEQELEIRKFCERPEQRRGYESPRQLVKIFADEGKTAGVPLFERPAGKELQLAIIRKEIDIIVVRNISRAFRSVVDAARVAEQWYKVDGVELRILDMPIDFGDKYGRFMFHILAAVSELDREIRNDRIREALTMARQRGIVGGSLPPVGHVFVRKNNYDLQVVRHEPTWEQMRWLHELHHEKNMGIDAIASLCGRKGISRLITRKIKGTKVRDRWTYKIKEVQQVWGKMAIAKAIEAIQEEVEGGREGR